MGALDIALKNKKNAQACGLDKIPGQVQKLDNFNDILLQLCNAVHFGNSIWTNGDRDAF